MAWTPHSKQGSETVLRAGGGVFFDSADQVGAMGYSGLGFYAYNYVPGATIPYTVGQLTVPFLTTPPYNSQIFAFPSNLQLPYTLQWNTSVEQSLGKDQAFTLSYVGTNGRRLLATTLLSLSGINPAFSDVLSIPGGVTSNYQALQAEFQRSVSHGLHALASYTWSHSIDFGSTALLAYSPLQRGNSDYDLRQNFQAGLSWDLPTAPGNSLVHFLLDDWGLDGRINARSAFPVKLEGNFLTDPSTGNTYYSSVNYDSSRPTYLYGSQYPGGRALNGGANNSTTPAFTLPSGTDLGNAPRNFVRGFGATQLNFAARRQFHLTDLVSLQFRAEAFNILNHPNFGYVYPNLTVPTEFGQATMMLNSSLGTMASQYQQGGARSMQFALKLSF